MIFSRLKISRLIHTFRALAQPGTPQIKASKAKQSRAFPLSRGPASSASNWCKHGFHSNGQDPWNSQSKKLKAAALAQRAQGCLLVPRAADRPQAFPPSPLCSSGGEYPDRHQHFCECPVAAAVLDIMPAQQAGRALPRPRLWLAALSYDMACMGVHQVAWQVACLASLGLPAKAGGTLQIEARRRVMPAANTTRRHRPCANHPGFCPTSRGLLLGLLSQGFCAAARVPIGWRSKVPSTGPFLRWHSQTRYWQPTRWSPQQA